MSPRTATTGCIKHCPTCGGPTYHAFTADTGRWYGCRACWNRRHWQRVMSCRWCQPELMEAS